MLWYLSSRSMVGMVGMRPQGLFYLYLCRRGTASFARYAHIRSYSSVFISARSSTRKIDSLLDTNFRFSGTRTRSMLKNMVLDRALDCLLCFGYQYSPCLCDNYAGEGEWLCLLLFGRVLEKSTYLFFHRLEKTRTRNSKTRPDLISIWLLMSTKDWHNWEEINRKIQYQYSTSYSMYLTRSRSTRISYFQLIKLAWYSKIWYSTEHLTVYYALVISILHIHATTSMLEKEKEE